MTTTLNTLPATLSTREDPFAQERAARTQPLLLHSLSLFREVFEVVYAGRDISTVVEVGVESGQVSSIYTELGASRVFCVDPLPSDELRARLAETPGLELVEKPSPQVLGELPVADLYVVDGDHNYATVRGEVDWIIQNAPDAVVVLHDVAWPCSRRDLYYQPSFIDAEQRFPDSHDGPTVWQDELTPAGFVGMGAWTAAVQAGGERNGVLTAVEDAIAAADDEWLLAVVPAVFGVGVMVRRSEAGHDLMERLRPFTGSRLLESLENNRIALYTRVLELQHGAVAAGVEAQRLGGIIHDQHLELERLNAELAAAHAATAERAAAAEQARAAHAAAVEQAAAAAGQAAAQLAAGEQRAADLAARLPVARARALAGTVRRTGRGGVRRLARAAERVRG